MLRQRFIHLLLSGLIIFSLLLSSAPLAQAQDGPVYLPLVNNGQGRPVTPASDLLFRVQVRVATPSQAAKLTQPGIVVLAQDEESATLLVDSAQLEYLAKAGFEPRGADALEPLVQEQGPEWLSPSLQPLLQEAATARQRLDLTAGRVADQAEALAGVRAALAVLAGEQRAALNELTELDSDGDGLTDTEESWWCTDALNPNSDGDAQGYSDGLEVDALLDATLPRNVRWGYGPPFGPPAAWPDFNNRDGNPSTPACNDGDWDTIPDYAEAYLVGTRVGGGDSESTDHDKFDDGQELFGITYCPGGDLSCGYGAYPRPEYWNFIKSSMPNWVLPPGDSPFVAAFPVPEVTVEAGSWTVERVTTITTSQGEMVENTNSYETAVTRGQSTSIANTVTWNEWEEVSQAVERPLAQVRALPVIAIAGLIIAGGSLVVGDMWNSGRSAAAAERQVEIAEKQLYLQENDTTGKDMVQELQGISKYTAQIAEGVSTSNERMASIDSTLQEGFQTTGQHLASIDSTLASGLTNISSSMDGVRYAINRQGALLSRGLHNIAYAISQPRLTETRTSGKSWGGAQTTTHEVYEEHTISEGEAFTTGQNWSTAWAVDSSHAADLTFRYSVRNAGTEYARELSNVVFNIYIGDDTLPTISYPAWEQFAGGKLDNLFPVGPNTPPGVVSTKTFASKAIPLSLEQMKRIDLGERLTVKVESFSYGADELFYVDAIAGGVTVYIEDGVEDGDETVDQYVIPTWGAESVQDVLTRYFPHAEDADGNLNSLWTPEFSGIDAPTWHEHYLSDIAWWNVYLTQADGGDTPLHQLPARAGSGIIFRFNRDSDRDGYNDRAEFRYYCALPAGHVDRPRCTDGHLRPEIHPQPNVLAGYVVDRSGNVATVKLALENTGSFDAYGIDAVMYSPDATTTIGNNTVGGNGKVRPGNKVTVGSIIKAPDLSNWGASRARPYAAGEYSGAADRTFTFTAQTPGVVGTGSTAVAWNDGAGASGVLQLGGSYHAPLPLDVAHGVQVGFNTGTIDAGARFTVQALTSRDTFTYTINSEPFTPPVIVVSYSDPQGSHRFVTPVQLPWLGDSLAPHANAMLKGIGLQIVATAPFAATGANTTNLVVHNPHPATIVDGHLHLNFVSDGKLVLEKSFTLNIPAGPTTFSAVWSATEFSADYKPNGDNLLIAFWTDSENNIIDSAARPLNSFAADPKPAAASDAAAWDFGTVTQGEALQHTVSIASVGDLDLLAYASASAGVAASQVGSKPLGLGDVTSYELTLDTRTQPTGVYSGTVTLRTSDPAHPLYTVQVSGEIQAASGDAYARTVTDRPLDVEVWVPGNRTQGEWITFEHPLGPEPQSLHPVKVYSQDGATLYGVGKYATDFSAGTASYDMFGDGRDGVMPGSGNLDNNNGFGIGIVNSGSAGATSINVTDAYAGWRINPGDVVLIHQTQGTGAGCWEMNKATSDYGGGTETIQLENPIKCTYASGGSNHAQVLRVPQYSTCNATGTITPLSPWNGYWGGIFAVQCSGEMNLSGTINVNGQGYRGGQGGHWCAGVPCYGSDPSNRPGGGYGESYSFPPQLARHEEGINSPPNNGAGGGGLGRFGGGGAKGGGGGSYGTTGTPGIEGGASPGSTYGTTNLDQYIHLGSGGGGGGKAPNNDYNSPGGDGGRGGGVAIIIAQGINIDNVGTIQSFGNGGGSASNTRDESGGGGGGSGGSILLVGRTVTLNTNRILASGGMGGNGSKSWEMGGNGGQGRIRIEYCESSTGSTNPGASTQKLDCFVTEQIESALYTSARLNLPENVTDGKAYRTQYARRLTLAAADEMTTTLRVPAGIWTAASLDVLISGVGSGDVTFKLDVGADGVWDWEETRSVTNAATLSSPDLAAAFAPYVSGAGQVNVPVKVSLSKPGQVLLTNMAVTRNQSVELAPAFALSGTPTEGAVVPLNATVTNSGAADSGPLTVSYYATLRQTQGDALPSPLAPQYIGSVFVPNIAAGGSEPAPFDWNTLGFTGPVTVTALVDPYSRIAESDKANNQAAASLTILTRPDLSVPAIAPSDPEPLAGQPVSVTVTLRNSGQTASGSQTVMLYHGNPGEGGVALGSQSLAVSAVTTETTTFTWTPAAPGHYRLSARADQHGVVDESNESNNTLWFDAYVGLASPVLLDSGASGEPAYTPSTGFGVVDEGEPDAARTCGAETQRSAPDGKLVYRFDHLQPGHYYHLDIHMAECDNAGRRQTVYVDGHPVSAVQDLGDGQPHRLSLLLDPALYADRTIRVTIEAEGIDDAIVDRMHLHDIDYRYADAGGSRDPQCTAASSYGWLDGTPNITWGTLPYRSLRIDTADNTLHYCFKALDPARRYNIHFTFWQSTGTARNQMLLIDGADTGLAGNVASGVRNDVTVPVPLSAYQDDGRIDVSIVRTNASTGAMANLVVLEEETLEPAGPDAPPGNAVLALSPSTASTGLGQTASMDIWVRTTQAVDGAAAYLDFNPALLQVASITPGSSLPTVLQRNIDNGLGRIDFAAGALTGAALNSDFLLATVVFTGVATTPGAPVTFAAAQPRRSDVTYSGDSVFHHSEDGNVIVTENVAALAGHVTPPGRPAAPDLRWRVPLRVTLSTVVGGPPVATFTPTSDESGNFVVSGISPGVYRVGVKMANSLRATVVVTFTATQTSVDFGALRGGDANDDNAVQLVDFSILRTTYGKCQDAAGYDARADFNGDDCVMLVDFSILRMNFGTGGDALRSGDEPATPPAPTVLLKAEPTMQKVAVGDLFSTSLRVDAGEIGVDGAAAYLTFDPAVVQVVGVTAGADLPDLLQNEVDNQAGILRFTAGGLEQTVSGVFDLANVELRAVGPGDAKLHFERGSLSQSDVTAAGVSMLQTVVDATVTVHPAAEPEVTPLKIFLPIVGGWE